MPLLVLQAYLWGTLLLFLFGPFRYPLDRVWPLISFVTLAHFALVFGYAIAVRREPESAPAYEPSPHLLGGILAFGVLWLGPLLILRLGPAALDLGSLPARVVEGLSRPGEAYADYHLGKETLLPPMVGRLSLLAAPAAFAALPMGLFYWSRLGVLARIAVALIAAIDLAGWLARGTNKGAFDLALIFPWVIVAGLLGRRRRFPTLRTTLIVAAAVVALALAVSLFSAGYLERTRLNWDSSVGTRVDDTQPLMVLTPTSFQPTLVGVTTYLTQGYFLLGLALEEPFVPCYGLGNSLFLQGLLQRWPAAEEAARLSYPGRLEAAYGYDRFVRWHTFYTWIASDISFPGTLILMAFVGWFLASVWRDAVTTGHPYAVVLLPLAVMMVLYLPANNQVLGFSGTAVPFATFLFLWIRWRLLIRWGAPRPATRLRTVLPRGRRAA